MFCRCLYNPDGSIKPVQMTTEAVQQVTNN